MFFRFLSFLLVFSAIQQLNAAGLLCFSSEFFQHDSPVGNGVSRSLLEYMPDVAARHQEIQAAVGSVGVSLKRTTPPTTWSHMNMNTGIGPLNLQDACLMAIERGLVNIPTHFQNPAAIAAVAAGFLPPLGVNIQSALQGGGYLTPLAAKLYRFRHAVVPWNFVLFPPNPMLVPNTIVVHFSSDVRISKNVKELSFNSIYNPQPQAGAAPAYVTIKKMIDDQHTLMGQPAPDSVTFLSSEQLQDN